MGWKLILRTRDDVRAIEESLPDETIAKVEYFDGHYGTIYYAAITKR